MDNWVNGKNENKKGKKKVHLIANAHLDPVWLWKWEEGCTEALSTFLTAADFIEEYEEFRFNHNEAILYEWVKENNSELFQKIREQVKNKKWEIIGGWYLQPDCNMPAGESIVRNILYGRKFFKENFNVSPATAVNFDSFGHSLGLVQILKQAGFDHYMVYRPGRHIYDFPDGDFIWEGLGGHEVVVHRSDEGYNSVWGQAAKELLAFLDRRQEEEVTLFLWGVGDHGGGPTREDLDNFRELIEASDYEIIHSTPDTYFEELNQTGKKLPRYNKGMNPVAEGCYTSQVRVKQKHRLLENEIYTAEKMVSAASLLYGREYREENFREAIKALIFSEFHDALPGSGTKLVEEDTLRLLDYGLELMSREKLYAAIALASGEEKVIHGTSVILFYNPHPYDITGVFECEVSLPKQNWDKTFMYPKVMFNGEEIPTQGEKESSNFGIDWRKKVVVHGTLKASSMNRMDVYFHPLDKRPEFDEIVSKKFYEFDNGEMKVRINTKTGLVDEYTVKGKAYLTKDSFSLVMKDDTYNPWGIGTGEAACERSFQLLLPHEGSYFSGLNREVIPSVRVIEDGEVRTVIEAVFGLHDSYAYIRYKLPKKGTAFEVEVLVQFNEKEQSLKLLLQSTAGENSSLSGQIMFGKEELKQEGREVVAQKWVMVTEKALEQSLLVLNQGTYGLSYDRGTLGLTLLRSAGYSAADGSTGKALCEKQYGPRMEQGERSYSFMIDAGAKEEMEQNADNKALVYNEKPYGFAYCPPGTGEKKDAFILIDNPMVVVSAIKKAENSSDFILRVYESCGKSQEAVVELKELGITQRISLIPNEIKTYIIDVNNKCLKETTIMEGI